MLFRKGTLLIPTGPEKHLHIVMNDPVFSPEHGDERMLLVNISSVKDAPYDNTCVLDKGEHPFIKRPSYVYYKGAVISSAVKASDKIALGEYQLHAATSETLYQKVLLGFGESRFVTAKIQRFIRKHINT